MNISTQKGVTLIELMVALAIFAIITSIAAPNFSTWVSDKRISSEAQKIAGAFKVARSESLALADQVTVTWDTNTGDIIVMDVASNEEIYHVTYSPDAINLIDNDNDNQVSFNAQGRSNKVLTVGVCSRNNVSKKSMAMELSSIGRVSVKDNKEDAVIACG